MIVHGSLAVSAGHTGRINGQLTVTGLVGREVDLPTARHAAGIAARNALSAIIGALGQGQGAHGRLRCLRLTVYIACTEEFRDLVTVADGASLALQHVLGPAHVPVRSAIGVRCLPAGAPLEVELTAAVD